MLTTILEYDLLWRLYLIIAGGLLGLVVLLWLGYSFWRLIIKTIDYYIAYRDYVCGKSYFAPRIENYDPGKGFRLILHPVFEDGFSPSLLTIPFYCSVWPVVFVFILFVYVLRYIPTFINAISNFLTGRVDSLIKSRIVKRNAASALTSADEDLRKFAEKVLKEKRKKSKKT